MHPGMSWMTGLPPNPSLSASPPIPQNCPPMQGYSRAAPPAPATPRPAYPGGSLVNLMSPLTPALGGNSPYAPLTALPPQHLADARHVVLLVIDGLGHDFLI